MIDHDPAVAGADVDMLNDMHRLVQVLQAF